MAQEIADSKLLDTWGSSGAKVKPDISKIIEGWQLGEQPPHEYMNWLQNTFGSKLNHILKNGIPKWDNETEYLAGASAQHSGSIWLCKTTNTNSAPTDSNNNWDKIPSIENLALTVDTIDDFPAGATTGDTCIVKDLNRGGTFIYDATKSAVNNSGTIFNGWVRQYSGDVNVKWFGAACDGVTDDSTYIQSILDEGYILDLTSLNVLVDKEINVPDGGIIYSKGSDKIIQGAASLFTSEGRVISEHAITTAITDFTLTVHVEDGSVFETGEVVRLVSSINCLSEDAGSMQLGRATGTQVSYFTEYVEIKSINGNVLTLMNHTYFNNYPLVAGSSNGVADRQFSVVQKIKFNTVSISGLNITSTSGYGVINLSYNKESKVSNNTIYKGSNVGGSISFSNCYQSTMSNNMCILDSNVIINYGSVNTGYPAYYSFNSLKLIGSQQCKVSENTLINGTQNIDVSYIDTPCLNNTIDNNLIYNARHNMLTTHSGSMNTTIISNVGNGCNDGIISRSRGDRILNNTIIGTRNATDLVPDKNAKSSGVSIWEGYNVNTVVANNYIEGFYRGVYFYDSTGGVSGHDYFRSDVINNNITYCTYGIDILRESAGTNYITTTSSGIIIKSNTFSSIISNALILSSRYIHGVVFNSNIVKDATSSYAVYAYEGDCKGLLVCDNFFHEAQTDIVAVAGISNIALLGENTLYNSGTKIKNNELLNGGQFTSASKFVFNGLNIANNNAYPTTSQVKYLNISSAITSLDISGASFLTLGNSSGGNISIGNITGGVLGQSLYLTGANTITLTEIGNIRLGGTPTALNTSKIIHLVKYTSYWILVA